MESVCGGGAWKWRVDMACGYSVRRWRVDIACESVWRWCVESVCGGVCGRRCMSCKAFVSTKKRHRALNDKSLM